MTYNCTGHNAFGFQLAQPLIKGFQALRGARIDPVRYVYRHDPNSRSPDQVSVKSGVALGQYVKPERR
jgi:hypothetical protein